MATRVTPSLDVRRVRGTSAVVTATPYEALDFVGGVYTFPNAIAPKKVSQVRSCEIRGARLLETQDAAIVTPAWNLALFRQLPTVASADEAGLDMTDANADLMIDFIHFPGTPNTHVMDLGSSLFYKASMPNGPITCVMDDADLDGVPTEDLSLYGVLQVLGVWTATGTAAPLIDLFVVAD